jgi:hypothetical protein
MHMASSLEILSSSVKIKNVVLTFDQSCSYLRLLTTTILPSPWKYRQNASQLTVGRTAATKVLDRVHCAYRQQRPSWEAGSWLATQILRFLPNRNVHCRVHKSLTGHCTFVRSISMVSSHIGLYKLHFLNIHFSSPIHDIYPAHPTWFFHQNNTWKIGYTAYYGFILKHS